MEHPLHDGKQPCRLPSGVAFRDLRHQQAGNGAQQYGGKAQHRHDHALNDAVGGQRPLGAGAAPAQAFGDQDVLCGHQPRPDPGAHRVRNGDAQQVAHKKQGRFIPARTLSVVKQRRHSRGKQVGKTAAAHQQQAGPGGRGRGEHRQCAKGQGHVKTELQHLDHRHAAGLALGGEQAVQTGGSRQKGQAEGQNPQARLQLRFIQPKRRHRPAEGIEQRARAQPQAKGIAQAQLHNAAPAAAVADTSSTSRVVESRTPEMARAVARPYTDISSSNRPMPAAPMRRVR